MASSSTVSLVTGTAQYSTSSLSEGSHTVYAIFTPNDSFDVNSSTSPSITQKVIITTSVSTLSVTATNNDNPIKKTDTLTLSVTVSDSAGQNPYGTVTFRDGSASGTILDTVTVSSGGSGSSVIYSTTTGNSVGGTSGNHTIYAVYTPADATTFSGSQNSLVVNFTN